MNIRKQSLIWAFNVVLLPLVLACSESGKNQLVGTLERERIELLAENNEPILSRHVQDGQRVKAGDLILQQDPIRAQAWLEHAQAQRDQSAARLAELQRGPRLEAIKETEARLAASKAQTSKSRSDLKRAQELFAQGLSSQAVLDQAESAFKTNLAEEEAVREFLTSQQHGTTSEELQQAAAALQAANAQVALAEVDLQRNQIRSPVSGRMEKLLYQVGERPAAGATLAVILDDARVYARVYVPESMRSQITPGKELQVSLDGVGAPLNGVVRWVSADATFTPYFALTEYDRSRLSYLAEIDLPAASEFPSGLPLSVTVPELPATP